MAHEWHEWAKDDFQGGFADDSKIVHSMLPEPASVGPEGRASSQPAPSVLHLATIPPPWLRNGRISL